MPWAEKVQQNCR
ncbi:transposase [Streptococcus lutetiensis 033]|uniref:Transposase n=1 Tax=Streptococcus lutetiensis 033 TaxID=1076934 RepID=A0AB33AM24_9STRE|nr:transposase [Streptococcus lutetiensis 033]AGS05586.1 transposase [Streptococcus lutetiensis 033]